MRVSSCNEKLVEAQREERGEKKRSRPNSGIDNSASKRSS